MSGSSPPLSFDPEQIQQKLDALKRLLEENDGDAGDCLVDILEQVQGSPASLQLKQVLKHIENYDFDIALENLKLVQI